MNNFISIFLLSFILCVQSYAQWEETNLPDTVKVNTLAVSDSSIFAGTDGDGIFVSTDNGESWVSINEGLQSKIIRTIFIYGTTIFAGTETGASITADNGKTWNTINSGLDGKGVWSFAVNNSQTGNTTIFAGTWSGVYSSTNNGTNWEATGLSSTIMPVHSMISCNNYIFAATLGGGVFNSQNNGSTWMDISIRDTDFTGITALLPVYSLAAIDTNIIASAGNGILYYFTYPKTIFDTVQSYPEQKKPILCFALHKVTLFAGDSVGNIFLSKFDGLIWNLISPPLSDQTIYSLALNNACIFAGTGSGIWRLWYPKPVTNIDNSKESSIGFVLEQNYPNPFNPVTTIKYSIPTHLNKWGTQEASDVPVQLKVYNLLGQEVAILINKQQTSGTYEVKFDGSNLPSGIYVYKLHAGGFVSTKKLMLLK